MATVLLPLAFEAAAQPASVGTLRELLPRRVGEARVTAGQAFAVALTRGGAAASGSYSLKVPGGSGPLVLTLEAPVFEGGRFSSPLRLANRTGLPLSGLRVDVTGATAQTSSEPNASSRDLSISLPSPLWCGELEPERETSPLLLEVDDLPDKSPGPVVILGIVSGAAVVEDAAEVAAGSQVYRSGRKQRVECGVDALTAVRGEGWGQTAQPVSCQLDPSGDLWIVDMAGDPVKVFDSRGNFIRSFGPRAGRGANDLALGTGGRVILTEPGEEGGSVAFRVLRVF